MEKKNSARTASAETNAPEGKANPDKLHKHSFCKVIFSLVFFFNKKKNNCATQIVLKELLAHRNYLELVPCSAQQPENQTRKKIRLPYKSTSPIFDVHIPHTNCSPLKKWLRVKEGRRQKNQNIQQDDLTEDYAFQLGKETFDRRKKKIGIYKITKDIQTANRYDCSLILTKFLSSLQ